MLLHERVASFGTWLHVACRLVWQVREKVKAGADWFVMDFDEMRGVLK